MDKVATNMYKVAVRVGCLPRERTLNYPSYCTAPLRVPFWPASQSRGLRKIS